MALPHLGPAHRVGVRQGHVIEPGVVVLRLSEGQRHSLTPLEGRGVRLQSPSARMYRQGTAKSRCVQDVWSSQSKRTSPPPVPYQAGPPNAERIPVPPVPPTKNASLRRASGVTFWAAKSTCADGPIRSIRTTRRFSSAGCRRSPAVDGYAGGTRQVPSLHDQECVCVLVDESGQPHACPNAKVPGGKKPTTAVRTCLLCANLS